MNQPIPQVTIETLTDYSERDAIDIGLLLPHLNDYSDGGPVPEQLLRDIIASSTHDQLVARDESGAIIGSATLSVVLGTGSGRKAWLEDFVVDPKAQGVGIGGRLWDALIEWCESRDAQSLNFTSRPSRAAAQTFYLKRGATIRDTNSFTKQLD